jgi:hypothetical protein
MSNHLKIYQRSSIFLQPAIDVNTTCSQNLLLAYPVLIVDSRDLLVVMERMALVELSTLLLSVDKSTRAGISFRKVFGATLERASATVLSSDVGDSHVVLGQEFLPFELPAREIFLSIEVFQSPVVGVDIYV